MTTRVYVPVFLVSAAAIAYEILLIRILSIIQWHHFAWMIISLALLGYGASGTVIALRRAWTGTRFRTLFSGSALLASLSMPGCLLLGQQLPFNALEIIWDPAQLAWLALLYLLFAVPFFFAAACIGLAFTWHGERADRVYRFDLVGAGLGSALAVGLMFVLMPQQAVLVCAALALAASLLMSGSVSRSRRGWLLAMQAAWAVGLLYALPSERFDLRISEFKGQSQALAVTGARVVGEVSGPLGLHTVVDSPRVPFRYAPGLSLTARQPPPSQLGVFSDADSFSAITRLDGGPDSLAFLGEVTAALPYRLLEHPRVLLLGAGTGYDVLLALVNGAGHVTAVELDARLAGLVQHDFADYAGHLYEDERVSLEIAEARGYVSRSREHFDLVQVAMLDSGAVAAAGAQALGENYLYTVEAFSRYLDLLRPGGLLTVTRWLSLPPRGSLKLAATAIEALRQRGVEQPGRQLAMIRSWNTVTLLLGNEQLSDRQVESIRTFARSRSFDTAWYPGMPASQANHYNRLERPWLYEGIVALLGDQAPRYLHDYKFAIAPATDARPYFSDFFRWRALPEIVSLRARGGAGLLEWGYLLLVATVLQALLAGALLILLPLRLWGRRRTVASAVSTAARRHLGGSYFFLLGLAFLFVEIAFIQKFALFLSHPLYSVAVVLAGFLVFAGLGSGSARGLVARLPGGRRGVVTLAVTAIFVLVPAYLLLLPPLFERCLGLPDSVRVMLALLLIAPLAFAMGLPFPLGLQRLAEEVPGYIPWAWAINGFASVVSAGLATLLAVTWGFAAVLLAAVLLYLAAAGLFRRR